MSEIGIGSETLETKHGLRCGGHWGAGVPFRAPTIQQDCIRSPGVIMSATLVGMIRSNQFQQDPVPERKHAWTWQRIV